MEEIGQAGPLKNGGPRFLKEKLPLGQISAGPIWLRRSLCAVYEPPTCRGEGRDADICERGSGVQVA